MMENNKILFNTEDIDFQLTDTPPLSIWIENTVQAEGYQLGTIAYVFCSDDYLHQMNVEYLEHDTLTDVITFPYNDDPIEGDIFISIDRVKDNAKDLGVSFETELYRVMIHGVLHLCGYTDETDSEEADMRRKEDECLAKLVGL